MHSNQNRNSAPLATKVGLYRLQLYPRHWCRFPRREDRQRNRSRHWNYPETHAGFLSYHHRHLTIFFRPEQSDSNSKKALVISKCSLFFISLDWTNDKPTVSSLSKANSHISSETFFLNKHGCREVRLERLRPWRGGKVRVWSSFPRLFADFWGDAKSQKKKRKLYSASKAKEKYFSEDSEHLQ